MLCGILIKLSYVFWEFFNMLDNGSFIGKITGITFAFASVYFVVESKKEQLKLTMVALDIGIILYYYLSSLWQMPIEYAAVIVAAYSGLIIYFIGRSVAEDRQSVTDTETIRLQNELNRLRTDTEIRNLEDERRRAIKALRESKTAITRQINEKRLADTEQKINKLKNNNL